MKVLFDHQFFPALRFSGISRYHYEILKYLSKQNDCDTSIFMGWHINEYAFDALKKEVSHFFGIKQLPWKFPLHERIYNKFNQTGLRYFARKIKPDIYHQTYYDYLLGDFSCKRIMTIHDMIYFLFPHYFDAADRNRQTLKKSLDNAAGVIVVSESTRRDLIEIGKCPEHKIRRIYEANALCCEPALQSPVDSPYILYVGQRFKWKNFMMLLKTFAETAQLHENFKLVCFGGLPWTDQEKELISKYDIGSKIFKTSGPDPLLASYYAHAAAFVYPSLYEGFGLPVLEAMHYGCPVIASKTSSIPEVGGNAASYFDPSEEEELREKLLSCLYDSNLRLEMSLKGKLQESKFSWEKCGEETYSFYKDIYGD